MNEKRVKQYIQKIKNLAKLLGREVRLMEVCGTHTQVIAQYGLKNFLPSNIKLLSGPGCPVCVTDQGDIDAAVELALSGVPIASYGDVLRVRGSEMSLSDAKRAGAKVYEVYGIEEAFNLGKDIVFFGIGFETTSPMSASAVKRGIKIYSGHKSFVPAMAALLSAGEIRVDGLISPGHVAAIVGSKAFEVLRTKDGKNIPQVISGFEIEDVVKGMLMLLEQLNDNRAETENEYSRVVLPDGNIRALDLLDEVFEKKESNWRGLGSIPDTGFELRKKFAELDAKVIYKNIFKSSLISCKSREKKVREERKCLCAEVIKGNIEAKKCPMFGKVCTPDEPQGPCMVSCEGACHIAYKFGKGND